MLPAQPPKCSLYDLNHHRTNQNQERIYYTLLDCKSQQEDFFMDHCRRIWFITPLGCVIRFLGIVAMFAFIITAFALLN